jgi:hypothetical protein
MAVQQGGTTPTAPTNGTYHHARPAGVPSSQESMAQPAGDRCPHPRPFPDDFRACPAYQPGHFVPLDTGYRPLGPVWVCGHLDSATLPQRYRFYAKCRIGDVTARAAWVDSQHVERLQAIRAMQDELNPMLAELVGSLWAEKANQLRSEAASSEYLAATARLHELRGHFLSTLERFLEDNATVLAELGFPLAPCLRLFENLLESWIEQPNAEVPVFPDSELEAFPPDTRVFFKPDYGAS